MKVAVCVGSWLVTSSLVLEPGVLGQEAVERPTDPGTGFEESDNADGRWNETDLGPFLASVVPVPGGTIAKGLSIRVGDEGQGAVVYDTATMTCRAAWTGEFVEFAPRRFGIITAPKPAGPIQWHTTKPAWGDRQVRYRGMHLRGKQVVLEYEVDGVPVLEMPWAFGTDPVVFTTTIIVPPAKRSEEFVWSREIVPATEAVAPLVTKLTGNIPKTVVEGESARASFFPYGAKETLVVSVGPAKAVAKHAAAARKLDLYELVMNPGSRLWPETLETKGTLGTGNEPYVVDTITVPFENPWKALMFLAGLDFLSDGTAVVSTLHGDVWLVKGIDENLEQVTWQRFATGLHQPLGVKVRRGESGDEVFVLGRDQITRLHDRNGDGEADFYECFDNAGATSTGGHDFAACLEADPEGNLYYIRAHEGVVRVSRDGTRSESIAKGFRNPIGLGVGPRGMITAAPQEGNWTPKSAIIEVRPGGWYGYDGPRRTDDRPLGYDPPLCWIPRLSDNSSGGQTWVTGEKWGPLEGSLLHLSYGQCAMLVVPYEHVGGVAQGGTLRMTPFFESGAMTGRFNPIDGQLYVAGLRGWQTAAAKDGCLQRVRYTGKPVHLPVELHVKRRGIDVRFTSPLDPKSAADPQNWAIEQWNYRYSKEYGSEDYRVSDPRRTGRDEVFLEDVTLSADGRTVSLVFEDDVEPVMQMGITYRIDAADGTELRDTIYNTINAVPE